MAPSSSPTSAASVTLRLATVEALGSPEAQAIAFFAGEVKRLSGGTVLVSPLIESADRDAENIEAVTSGAIEMIITQARNWDEFGVTSMQALQTPFLITSSALGVRPRPVTRDELIGGLHSKGVDGLALWPTDLRHPVSFGAPLVSPADFKGIEFRIPVPRSPSSPLRRSARYLLTSSTPPSAVVTLHSAGHLVSRAPTPSREM